MSGAGNFALVLAELAGAFDRKNDRKVYQLTDDPAKRPSWLAGDAGVTFMREIHEAVDSGDARLPDDWIYEHTYRVASALDEHDPEDPDTAREAAHEVCDGLVDVYNSARHAWLASHLYNASLCDEACKELGATDADITERIGLGQYLALTRIAEAIISAVETESDAREDADEE